jgi:hypothetical protein
MSLHVVGECSVDGTPIACYVKYDEKKEEKREEDEDGAPLSFIDVQNLLQRIAPSCNDPVHQ